MKNFARAMSFWRRSKFGLAAVEIVFAVPAAIFASIGPRETSRFGVTGSTQTVYPGFRDIAQPGPFEDRTPYSRVYDPGQPFRNTDGNVQWETDMGVAENRPLKQMIRYINKIFTILILIKL